MPYNKRNEALKQLVNVQYISLKVAPLFVWHLIDIADY